MNPFIVGLMLAVVALFCFYYGCKFGASRADKASAGQLDAVKQQGIAFGRKWERAEIFAAREAADELLATLPTTRQDFGE